MESDRKIREGDRVYDHTRPNRTGKLLRIETYPGTGPKKWGTVLWDGMMSSRRVEPTCLRRLVDGIDPGMTEQKPSRMFRQSDLP